MVESITVKYRIGDDDKGVTRQTTLKWTDGCDLSNPFRAVKDYFDGPDGLGAFSRYVHGNKILSIKVKEYQGHRLEHDLWRKFVLNTN